MTDLTAIAAQVELLKYCKRKEAELKAIAQQARSAIEEALGDSEIGTVGGEEVVRWRHIKTHRLDQKALKADHPDIVAGYTEAVETRRFEVL